MIAAPRHIVGFFARRSPAAAVAALALAATSVAAIPCAALAAGAQTRQTGAPARPAVTAARAEGPIVIDGRLDEPDWLRAAVIPDLVQAMPHPGEPTPYRTEVRILVDDENLYFGVTCFDPDPSKIAMHTMRRDTVDPSGDDFLDLLFDTFGDRHTGYLFEIYPTGAQTDGLISGPGSFSTDWDGVWEAKTSVGPQGWIAEVKIPSRSIHFKVGLDRWGFNVWRHVARERMYVALCCATLDIDPFDFTRVGTLEGVGGLTQGRGLSVTPYGLARLDRPIVEPDQSIVGQGGLDLTYSLTPGLPAVATVNPDFAETEVDTRQINLTRFALFFPEKRPFFLEGSNQFSFSSGLGTDFIPFYSRRLGLVDTDPNDRTGTSTEPVPIDWGAKIIGHAGKVGIAALDIETGTSTLAPRTNLFSGRLTFDATDNLRLGLIATHGDPDRVSSNALTGLDLVWHTSNLFGGKNMTATGWAARTGGDIVPCTDCPASPGKRTGWGAGIYYPNDLWNAYASFNEFGDALTPALGFLPRPGTREYQIGQAYQPRPDKDGSFSWARQFFFETFYTQFDDLLGRTESRSLFTAPINVELASGEHLEANWIPQYEALTAPFEVVTGVVIPPGHYDFTRYRLEVESSEARPWRIGSTVRLGGFYDGRLTQSDAFVSWSVLHGHWQQRLELVNDYGRMPEGNFIQRLWQLQNVFAFSPDLILFSYFQYDTDSGTLGMNTRLRWTFRPGSDLFLVWNRNWEHPIDSPSFALDPVKDEVTLKVRFVWRG